MAENPFIIAEKIIPEYFCDRKKESQELIDFLRNGNNVVMVAPRRIGKSGLIQFCFQQKRIKQDFLTVYIDILSTTNLQEFTYLLGLEVFNVVRSRGDGWWKRFFSVVKSIAGKISFDPVSGLPSLNLQLGDISQPSFTLKEIFEFIDTASKPCIIAIDEFQQITRYPENNIEALIRGHLLQINNCRMIFSGSEANILSRMFIDASRPFYLSATIMELKTIPSEVYIEFIKEMFRKKSKRISTELCRRIYDMFDGITFYIQRLCNAVFSNTGYEQEATEEILRNSLEGILSSYDVVFRLRLSQLSTKQKELLYAIAQEELVSQPTSAEFIQRYSLSSASATQTALKSLIKNQIVVKNDNGYRIDDRFFHYWLRRFLNRL